MRGFIFIGAFFASTLAAAQWPTTELRYAPTARFTTTYHDYRYNSVIPQKSVKFASPYGSYLVYGGIVAHGLSDNNDSGGSSLSISLFNGLSHRWGRITYTGALVYGLQQLYAASGFENYLKEEESFDATTSHFFIYQTGGPVGGHLGLELSVAFEVSKWVQLTISASSCRYATWSKFKSETRFFGASEQNATIETESFKRLMAKGDAVMLGLSTAFF